MKGPLSASMFGFCFRSVYCRHLLFSPGPSSVVALWPCHVFVGVCVFYTLQGPGTYELRSIFWMVES